MEEARVERVMSTRRFETRMARRAREQGYLPIERTSKGGAYVSEMAALNLQCPWNGFADWHRSMWQAPPELIDEKGLRERLAVRG